MPAVDVHPRLFPHPFSSSTMSLRGCDSVGIDLGTTYSAMAYMDDQSTPRMVQDGAGQAVVPSVVYFDDEEVIVGDIALQQARMDPDRVVQFIKVHVGDEWSRVFNGRIHTPESISAIILAHLIREAEPQIGRVTSAVVTVPAYFTEKRRRATQQAGEIAGLKVIGTLNEPMAAALAFGLYREDREQTAVIYDLGGGTFDVTVVRISPNELVELATYGNRQLGGKDWDQVLVNYVADDFQRACGADPRLDPLAMQDLLVSCEEAKRRISRFKRTDIRLQALGYNHTCEVTREEFERLTAPMVQTTRLTTELALEDAKLKWRDVSRVVLVGGSTHMPMIRTMLREISGREPDSGVNPVLAVALGAAQYAQLLESGHAPQAVLRQKPQPDDAFELEEQTIVPPPLRATVAMPSVGFVTAHGVGIKAYVNGKKSNYVLIHKNTRVPCQVSRTFTTKANDDGTARERLPIQVTQGDTPNLELAEVLGSGEIEGIPPNQPAGKPVRVTMEFDTQGRLAVYATYVETGQQLAIELEIPGGLAAEKVEEYRNLLEETGLIRQSDLNDPLLKQFEFDLDDDLDDDDVPLLEPVD